MNRGLAVCVLASGCGRIGFDSHSADATSDTGPDLSCVGSTTTGASCAGLPANCGPTRAESCCTSPPVCGGTFFRGYDLAADQMFAGMARPATVSTFRLDRYEVTVGRFRQFVNAGTGTQAMPPDPGAGMRMLNGAPGQAGWDAAWDAYLAPDTASLKNAISGNSCGGTLATWTDNATGDETLPINCLSWFEAMAFCVWDGGFLPTEAESMYAASAGSLQRAFPWSEPASSTTVTCNLANVQLQAGACSGPPPFGAANSVGSEPAGDGAWGQADLAGDLWEWVLDWYAPDFPEPCSDCANLTTATMRIYRGGGFNVDSSLARSPARYDCGGCDVTMFRHPALGVRCARSP